MTAPLAAPVAFRGGTVCGNHLALAPLTNGQSEDDGVLGDDELRWLTRRAAGGFGLVETCAAHVAEDGKAFDGQLGVWSDRHLPGLTRLATAIAGHGALGVVQLHHGGVRAPSRLTGVQPWSASAFTEDKPGFEPPRAATDDDLARVIGQFRDAAARSRQAGFAGVELHGAHGYLLSQFLSRTMNLRTDRWGAGLDGRARLLREVTRAVRAVAPPPFVLGVRISAEDFGQAHGLDLDESLQVASWLADDGIDYLHLSLWDVERPTAKRPDELALPLFRAQLPADVRIMVAGKVWTRADAERQLERGADLIAVGRAAIVDPDWPRHVAFGSDEPRRPPLTRDELRAVDVGEKFVTYLQNFRGMVAA
ncbi:MAG: NADH:flavin oxidoreductase [Kofleriaceae bacterium]|nr:NADH:flavin oxidoreductase [Kofleriaceae bacterium]